MLAARTMGASPTHAFFKVYLPILRPSLLSGALLIFILSLSFFVVPAILGGPRDQTIAIYIQQQIDIFRWGIASAMGVLLLVATVICYVGVLKLAGSLQSGGIGSVQAKGMSAETPFRWTPVTIVSAGFTAVAIALLIVPVLFVFPLSIGETGTVVFPPRGFTLKWFAAIFTTPVWIGPLIQSMVVGLGAATLSVRWNEAVHPWETRLAFRSCFAKLPSLLGDTAEHRRCPNLPLELRRATTTEEKWHGPVAWHQRH